jgi:hypothetical protein
MRASRRVASRRVASRCGAVDPPSHPFHHPTRVASRRRRTSRRRTSRRVARDRRVDDRSRAKRPSERGGTARRGDAARARGTMSLRPGSKASERKKGFKKAIDADEARRKREGARGDARER